MSKIFIDANILLDILLPTRKNHKRAVEAYEKICFQYDILCVNEDILTTIEYIASKNGTDCKVIWEFFTALSENFEIYNFNVIFTEVVEEYGKKCQKGKRVDFEDLLQIRCAIKNGCDAFLTEDGELLKGNFGVKVLCLENFLENECVKTHKDNA